MGARNGQPGLRMGDIVAGSGALLLLVSLWRPWYELRIPDELISQARAFSSRMGELGPVAQQGLDQVQAQGPVPLTAWQVFEQADTVMAVAAALALGLVLLNAAGALSARLDGVLVLAGLMASATVVFRLVSPPGADVPVAADLLQATTGAYVALAGALLMAAGGAMAAMNQAATAPAPPPAQPIAADQIKIWDAS